MLHTQRPGLVLILVMALLLSAPLCKLGRADEKRTDPAAAFSKVFPQLKFFAVSPSPIAGLYEVLLEGDKIVYFAPESGHLLAGALWSPENRNLTQERIEKLKGERIKDLPLDKALKIGKGKKTVIIVTDPDCPYCRKGDEFLAGRNDITSYIYFLPLSIHPDAAKKAAYVLSSDDPSRSYGEVMLGLWDKRPLPAFKDNGLLDEHRKIVTKLGVSGTPAYWINGTFVAGANIEKMRELLDDPLLPEKP